MSSGAAVRTARGRAGAVCSPVRWTSCHSAASRRITGDHRMASPRSTTVFRTPTLTPSCCLMPSQMPITTSLPTATLAIHPSTQATAASHPRLNRSTRTTRTAACRSFPHRRVIRRTQRCSPFPTAMGAPAHRCTPGRRPRWRALSGSSLCLGRPRLRPTRPTRACCRQCRRWRRSRSCSGAQCRLLASHHRTDGRRRATRWNGANGRSRRTR
mmetsp:Transcript_9315/g.30848  ORF Transcript_9315/g.30848 Transcript_9315/m.30848 type:complete len:213 (-) Transcript_9315:1029-1667(-)